MVLLYRTYLPWVFKGVSDARRLFFYSENSSVRGKTNGDESSELVAYIDGAEFDLSYEKFSADEKLNPETSEFLRVKD